MAAIKSSPACSHGHLRSTARITAPEGCILVHLRLLILVDLAVLVCVERKPCTVHASESQCKRRLCKCRLCRISHAESWPARRFRSGYMPARTFMPTHKSANIEFVLPVVSWRACGQHKLDGRVTANTIGKNVSQLQCHIVTHTHVQTSYSLQKRRLCCQRCGHHRTTVTRVFLYVNLAGFGANIMIRP